MIRRTSSLFATSAVVLAIASACGSTSDGGWTRAGGGDAGGGASSSGGFGGGADASSCAPDSQDLTGCPCSQGGTHACYTGPAGTRGVGACHDGTQTCSAGEHSQYGPCTGATLPSPEAGHCGDGVDNDCNGRTDCADPVCAGDPACKDAGTTMDADSLDGANRCSPPDASRRCPQGTVPRVQLDGGMLGLECCPCTANDCNKPTCCVTAACSGSPTCATCGNSSLNPVCNGLVDADCDDFPEDCDQLCCPCKPAICGSCNDPNDVQCNGICTNVVTNPKACGACDYVCPQGWSCSAGECHQ